MSTHIRRSRRRIGGGFGNRWRNLRRSEVAKDRPVMSRVKIQECVSYKDVCSLLSETHQRVVDRFRPNYDTVGAGNPRARQDDQRGDEGDGKMLKCPLRNGSCVRIWHFNDGMV